MAAAVGTVSQLMIFTDPASAVSHPRPTPASADNIREHGDEDQQRFAVAAKNARTGRYPRRSRKCRIHTQTRKGNEIPAVALTAIATVIRMMPSDVVATESQRDTGGHQAHHQHLVVHPTHQVDEHQWVEYADPQRRRAVTAQMAGQARGGPDQ